MKNFRKLKVLRIWRPDSQRIRQKLFFKSEVLFGSDNSADICIENISGLEARLDFERHELHWIEKNRIDEISTGEIFQIGDFVFQWKELHLFQFKWMRSLMLMIIGIFALMGGRWVSQREIEKQQPCTSRALVLFQNRTRANLAEEDRKFFEDFDRLKASFDSALKMKEWAKARAELNEICALTLAEARPGCDTSELTHRYERKFSRRLIADYLKNSHISAAALEIRKAKGFGDPEGLDRYEKRAIREARKLYFEGYRLEEEDPERADDLMSEAEQVCKHLELQKNCFKIVSEKRRGTAKTDEEF